MSALPDEEYDWAAARARLDESASRVGDAPPAWLPEPGDEIVGVVVEFNPAVHTKHGPVPVVTLQGPNGGRRSVWLAHAVLRRGFIRANVQLGEVVLVRYVGPKVPEGGGNVWHDYVVVPDRDTSTGAPDWAAVARAHEDGVDVDTTNGAGDAAPEPPPPVPPRERDERCRNGDHDFDTSLPADERRCRRCGEPDIPF